MTKNFRIRQIMLHRTYTYKEASVVIKASAGAIRRWVKEEGLPLLTKVPQHLILGKDLRAFLVEKQAKRRVSVPAGHIFCLTCKKACLPVVGTASLTEMPMGALRLHAECSVCGGKLRKKLNSKQVSEFGF